MSVSFGFLPVNKKQEPARLPSDFLFWQELFRFFPLQKILVMPSYKLQVNYERISTNQSCLPFFLLKPVVKNPKKR